MTKNRADWKGLLPVIIVHMGAILAFFYDWGLPEILLALGSYTLRMLGITIGYHRYFSHRSFKTSRLFQFILAFVAQTSGQKGALWWAAHHRHHHRHSDSPEDIHSPTQQGFRWSRLGWIMMTDHLETDWIQVSDLQRFPELRWLNRFQLVPPLLFAYGLFSIWGWNGLFWGGCVATCLLFHGTFTINSLSHLLGSRRYDAGDNSRNSFILSLLTCGEGWHNNHHQYPQSAQQGWFWWEMDLSFLILRFLSAIGVVWDLRLVPPNVKELTISAALENKATASLGT